MAERTPTPQDIEIPGLRGERPIAGYDLGPAARGAQALARGAEVLGTGIAKSAEDFAAAHTERTRQQAENAKTSFATDLIAQREKWENVPYDDTVKPRRDQEASELAHKYLSPLPPGAIRDHVGASFGEMLAHESLQSAEQAHRGQSSAALADYKSTLDTAIRSSQYDPNETFDPTHNTVIAGIDAKLATGVRNNYWSQAQAETMREAGRRAYANRNMDLWTSQDPVGYLAARGEWMPQAKVNKVLRGAGGAGDTGDTGTFLQTRGVGRAGQPGRAQGLNPDFASRLQAATQDYETATGKKAAFEDFRRTTTEQAAAYHRFQTGQGGTAAPPGQSRHEIGEAADMPDGDFQKWMHANGSRYGLEFLPSRLNDPGHVQLARGAQQGAPQPGSASVDHPLFSMLDPTDLMRHDQKARTVIQQHAQDDIRLQNQVVTDRTNDLRRLIVDGASGHGAMPPREMIADDPVLALNEAHRNTLLSEWDHANKQDESFQAFVARFRDPNAGPFNQVDKEDKDNADKLYQILASGGPQNEVAALQTMVDRTGIVPKSAATAMHGAIVSNNPQRLIQASQMALNLTARNPHIFAGVPGEKELEAAAAAYDTQVNSYGRTPEEAAQEIIKQNDPANHTHPVYKLRGEDADDLIKKQLSVTDLTKWSNDTFRESWIPGRGPTIGIDEDTKQAAFHDYASLFKDFYRESGDKATAENAAIRQLKKSWGVSYLTGSGGGVLMKFPPERARAYIDIPDASNRIADAAIADLKSEFAPAGPQLETNAPEVASITRDSIILTPIPRGVTAAPYFSGQNVPYTLAWKDKNDHDKLHVMNPGRAFVFDAAAEQEKISEERRIGLEKGAARSAADAAYRARAFGLGPGAGQIPPAPAGDAAPAAAATTDAYVEERLKALNDQEKAVRGRGPLGGPSSVIGKATLARIERERAALTAPAAAPAGNTPQRLSPQGVIDVEGNFMDNIDDAQAGPGLKEATAKIPVRADLLTQPSKNIERRGDYDIFDKFRYHPLFDQIKRLFDEKRGTDNKLSKNAGVEDIDRVVEEALLRTYGRKRLAENEGGRKRLVEELLKDRER